MRGPRKYSEKELKKVGVTLTDPERVLLHCDNCGGGWSPMIKTGGKLARLYWVCPHCKHNDPRLPPF